MIVGIDATNIPHNGGGGTHIVQLLRAADLDHLGIDEITVWGSTSLLSRIQPRPWLNRVNIPALDSSSTLGRYWQRIRLSRTIDSNCDVLFAPGATYSRGSRPVVSMCQNILPFDKREVAQYGVSGRRLRFWLLRQTQSRSFQKADGLILLSRYAQETLEQQLHSLPERQILIPHGTDDRFRIMPRPALPLNSFSRERPIRVLYVSFVGRYKNQWNVVEAIALLRKEGLPIHLDLIGPIAERSAMKRLLDTINRKDADNEFISYHGEKPYAELIEYYRGADIFVFASSCENLSIIQLEAMAAGLPIACSNRASMPEVLGGAGVYFDPEQPMQIAEALRVLVHDPVMRDSLAKMSYQRSFEFQWSQCAADTLQFVEDVYNHHK